MKETVIGERKYSDSSSFLCFSRTATEESATPTMPSVNCCGAARGVCLTLSAFSSSTSKATVMATVDTTGSRSDISRARESNNNDNDCISRCSSRFLQSPGCAQTVSNTYAQVAKVQSCANHVQHIERLSCATCRVPLDMKEQLSY